MDPVSRLGSQFRLIGGYLAARHNLHRPLEQLLTAQWRAAQRMLAHAYENVPFYRDLLDRAGIRPADVVTRSDWERLPLVDKAMIRAAFPQRSIARGYTQADYVHDHTSGSSGTPLSYVVDRRAVEVEGLMSTRVQQYAEPAYGDRFAYVCPLEAGQESRQVPFNAWNRLTRRWRNLPGQRVEISPWLEMERIVELLSAYRPDVLMGYGSILLGIAKTVTAGSTALSLRACYSTAEYLPEEHRRFIERALSCRVFRIYGSREFGEIGGECAAFSGYHVNVDALLVELVRGGRAAAPGEQGEIVVTSLSNFAMPFIRYRIGDIGIMSDAPCPCGRTLPLLQEVIGRTADVVTAPNGDLIAPEFFWNPWREIPGLLQAQLIQETIHRLRLRLAVSELFDRQAALSHLEQLYRRRMGEDVQIAFEFVEQIDREPSGKYRMVKSLIPVAL